MNNRLIFLFFLLGLQGSVGFCDVTLPRLISDGAILQRDINLNIWGWASANEEVTLSFKNNTYTTKATQNGKWQLTLPPQNAGGPYEMTIIGDNEITLRNILFGDVWLCSGQSNMELTMHRLKDTYPKVIQNSKNSRIRQFLVPDKYDFNKEYDDLEGGIWEEANPENLLEFSGVAYFFAKELNEKHNIPIGLINASLGGSPVEAWMSEDALKKFPEAYAELQQFKDDDFVQNIEEKDKTRQQSWYAQLNADDIGFETGDEWFLEKVNDTEWAEMEVPGYWADGPLGDVNGVVWFRKTVTIPREMAEKEARLWLGRAVDQDHVYVNGEFVGSTGYQYPPRKYIVRKGLLKEGENTIAVRLINEQGRGGFFFDKPYFLDNGPGSRQIDLKGPWKYQLGTEMSPLQSQTFVRWKAGGLYKKMIAPLLPYKIKGVIWYQGESNTKDPQSYTKRFPALINNWRDKWQIGDFPFLFVQLANFMKEINTPTESKWAELRQAQLETLAVPNTGMAVIIDIGEWNDIHPLNKKDVGLRLAEQAYKLAYGEKDAASSPIPIKAKFSNKKVMVKFSIKKLKVGNGEALRSFELSEDGRNFSPAYAKIKGRKVMVWNDKITNATVVRYAWSNNPAKANLNSPYGLPTSPFELRK